MATNPASIQSTTPTGKELVDWFKNTKAKFAEDDFIKIYIDYPRQDLLDKISTRADQMLKQGAIEEVKKFLKLKIERDKTSNKVIQDKKYDKMFLSSDKARDTATWIMTTW